MKYIDYDKEKLGFYLDNYCSNGALFVNLSTNKGELYADLSINIDNYMYEFEEEIAINNDVSNNLVNKLIDMGILIDMHKNAYSGFSTYRVMYFNKDVAKDYIFEDYSFEGDD